jgi:hypothetical protein
MRILITGAAGRPRTAGTTGAEAKALEKAHGAARKPGDPQVPIPELAAEGRIDRTLLLDGCVSRFWRGTASMLRRPT